MSGRFQDESPIETKIQLRNAVRSDSGSPWGKPDLSPRCGYVVATDQVSLEPSPITSRSS
jgi:hypothetical protein